MWTSPAERAFLIAIALTTVSVLGTVALLAANRVRQSRDYCEEQAAARVRACAVAVQRTFDPIVEHLQVLRAYGQNGTLRPCDVDHLHLLLPPLTASLKQADEVIVADAAGCGAVLRRTDGVWRLAPASTAPERLAEFERRFAQPGAPQTTLRWAISEASTDRPTAAVTAYVAWPAPGDDGASAFAAAMLPIAELRASMAAWPTGEFGQIMVSGSAIEAVFLSPTLADGVEVIRRDKVEQRSDLVFGPLPETLRTPGFPSELPVANRVHNPQGWVWQAYTATTLGDDPVWIGLALPESELLGSPRTLQLILLVMLFAMLATGLGLVLYTTHHYRRRVRVLTSGPNNATAERAALRNLIDQGESEQLEFKSTLRWNLKADRVDKAMSLAWLKTLVAFMNSNGGTLLVGVRDDGAVIGIEADRFENNDKYLLHFSNLIKQHIGVKHAGLISFAIREIDGGEIFVVDCGRSDTPVFLKDGDEESFFVRVGPGSRKLPASAVLEYVASR